MAESVDVETRMTEVTAQTTLVFTGSVQDMIRHILSYYTFLFSIFTSGGFLFLALLSKVNIMNKSSQNN